MVGNITGERSARAIARLVAAPLLAALAVAPHAAADDVTCAVTPGGWGAPPQGGNPGALLHANFDAVFGDALVVGPFRFETAQEVTDLLPAASDPLLNHAVALEINLAFGAAGLLDDTLQGVEVVGGPFDGKTAGEILALAEAALADPSRSTSKYSSLIDAMTGLNEERFGCAAAPPPKAPKDIECRFEDGAIIVEWSKVGGVDSYNVYRSAAGGPFILVGTSEDEEFVDNAVVPGVTYRYYVTSVKDSMESGPSPTCTVTAIPFFPGVAGAAAAGAVVLVGYAAYRRR